MRTSYGGDERMNNNERRRQRRQQQQQHYDVDNIFDAEMAYEWYMQNQPVTIYFAK